MKKAFLLLVLVAFVATGLAQSKLYWTEAGTNPRIVRANMDGSNPEILVDTGLQKPIAIVLDESAGKMYWTDWWSGKIIKANLDGSAIEDLIVVGGNPYALALDIPKGKIYWTDMAFETISRCNLDGSNYETLISTGLSTPLGIAIDTTNGEMYWADYGTQTVKKANLDGSNVQTIFQKIAGYFEPTFDAIAFNVNTNNLYVGGINDIWLYNGTLYRYLDTLNSFSYVQFMALNPAANEIYFTEWYDNKISKGTIVGNYMTVELIASVSEPRGIAIAAGTTGVNSINNTTTDIKVSPNPTNSTFTISGNYELPAVVELYDITGRQVYRQTVSSNQQKVDISFLSKGLYLWKLSSKLEGTAFGKLVKQ